MKIELSKRNQYAAVALLVLLVLAFVVGGEPAPPPPEATPPELDQIDPTTLSRIEIVRDGGKETIELIRTETGWMLSKPSSYASNEKFVDTMLEKLSTLDVVGIEAETNAHHDAMQVTDEEGVRVSLYDAAGTLTASLIIGKAVKGSTLLRKVGEDIVYRAAGTFRFNFDKPARDWRDKAIYPAFTKEEVLAVRVEHAESTEEPAPGTPSTAAPTTAAPGTAATATAAPAPAPKVIPPEAYLLVRNEASAWTVEEPLGAPIDGAKVDQLVQALATLRAFDFADTTPRTEAGLDAPSLKITVMLKPPPGAARGAERVLLVGKLVGDELFAGTEESPQVFKLKKYAITRFSKRIADLAPTAAPPTPAPRPMPGMPPGVHPAPFTAVPVPPAP